MITEGTLYRPPVEANTFLLQITAGCTHNGCRFCNMYKDKKFHLIDDEIIVENLKEAKKICDIYERPHRRMFLADGDVFSLSADKLEEKINLIRKYHPQVETFAMYAAVRTLKNKSDDDLLRLKSLGVNDLYIGYECGLDDVLLSMNKGHTVAEAVQQAERLNKAGISHNALIILGLAGKGRGEENAYAVADMINKIKPKMTRLATLSVFPNTGLEEDIKAGTFVLAGEKEILTEEKIIIENINLEEMHLWACHVTNSVRLEGYIGKDREWMLAKLSRNIDSINEEVFAKTFKRNQL